MPDARQLLPLLLLERAEPLLLLQLLVAAVLQVALQRHEPVMLERHLIAEDLHAPHECAVAQRDQVEVLVPRHQLAEGLGR
ncbi:MAG: hypothetical protein E6H78_20250 [Betaproteobacteria bacterium]|nr:MAG: hypothetical protein E6H78_20250 [Betaproteobacteria bacterium]